MFSWRDRNIQFHTGDGDQILTLAYTAVSCKSQINGNSVSKKKHQKWTEVIKCDTGLWSEDFFFFYVWFIAVPSVTLHTSASAFPSQHAHPDSTGVLQICFESLTWEFKVIISSLNEKKHQGKAEQMRKRIVNFLDVFIFYFYIQFFSTSSCSWPCENIL